MAVEKSDAGRLFAGVLVVLFAAGVISVLLVSEVRGDVSGAAFNSSSGIPAGYSPPWNIFAGNAPFLTVVVGDPTSDAVPIAVSASQQGMIFYKYYYVSENGAWQQYTFPQATISGSGWMAENASANTTLDPSSLADGSDNYVLVYGCTKVAGAWKCGCSSPNQCGRWSIQRFNNPVVALPGCPPDPACSGRAAGDTFCVASQPSQVFTCTADADGCLVASNETCAEDSSCTVSNGTAGCAFTTIHPCEQVQPSGDNYACGTTNPYTLCGNAINITGTHCDAGTCQDGACVSGNFTYCSAASRNATACTDVYSPVCGDVGNMVECFAAPCPSIENKTYSNACNACLHSNVIGYTLGACAVGNNVSCTDSDGGKNIYVKGTVTTANQSFTDTCAYCTGLCQPGQPCTGGCGAVQEYDCNGSAVVASTVVCPAGNTCVDGACVAASNPTTCAAPKCLDPLTGACVAELDVGNVSGGVGQLCVNGAWGPQVPAQ